jgi:hypothetical protein
MMDQELVGGGKSQACGPQPAHLTSNIIRSKLKLLEDLFPVLGILYFKPACFPVGSDLIYIAISADSHDSVLPEE